MSPEEARIAQDVAEVKEAVTAIHRRVDRHAELAEKSLERVEKEMESGFRRMEAKQDITNGNVRALQIWQARVGGAMATVGLGKPIVYLAVGVALTILGERLF